MPRSCTFALMATKHEACSCKLQSAPLPLHTPWLLLCCIYRLTAGETRECRRARSESSRNNTRCSGLARPRAPALQCLNVFLGAGSCPGALSLVVCALGWYQLCVRWDGMRCVCAGMASVAPAVGAVLVCACGTGGRRCGLTCVWYLR